MAVPLLFHNWEAKKAGENFASQRIIINFAPFLAQSLAGHAARYIA
jgi:hypothetical protein